MRIFFDRKSIPAQIQHLTHLTQAKEEEVKRKQSEVEAAMKILDRLIDQQQSNSIFSQPFHLVVAFQLWVTFTLC